MITAIKWIVGALLAGLAWLITGYAVEYFKPYKQVKMRIRKK